jgi:hypothetical protein
MTLECYVFGTFRCCLVLGMGSSHVGYSTLVGVWFGVIRRYTILALLQAPSVRCGEEKQTDTGAKEEEVQRVARERRWREEP